MKRTLFAIAFLWPVMMLSQNFQWAVSCAKGHEDDFGVISANSSGDIFLTGSFSPPLGIFGNDTLDPWGGYLWVMLTKINSKGEFQWTKGIKIQGEQCSPTQTFAEACRLSDDVLFLGNACGDLYFDTIHFVNPNPRMFISKYDRNGNCIWAIEPAGSIPCAVSQIVTMDSADNIIMMGFAGGTVSFNGITVGPGRFLAKFSSDGICTWVKHINFYSGIVLQELCRVKDGGFIFAGHTFSHTVIIETDTLTSSTIDGGDLLLVKYDSTGKYLWSKLDGQTGAVSWAIKVQSDNSGNFFVTGIQGYDSLVFGDHILPTVGGTQMFLVKYDSTGNALWAVNTNGSPESEPRNLFISDDNKVYVTGGISLGYNGSTITFGSFTIQIDFSAMFVACYDSNGICLGVRYAQSEYRSRWDPSFYGSSVHVYENGSFVVAGSFGWNAYFDEITLTSMGKKDIFIANCNPITGVEELKTTPQNQLLIYANPNTGKCNITIPEEFASEKNLVLQIFDLQGKLIQQSKIEIVEGKIKLDIQAQAKGMYTAVLNNGKKSYSGKIVIE
jgi:hypothetical protein